MYFVLILLSKINRILKFPLSPILLNVFLVLDNLLLLLFFLNYCFAH